MFSRAFRSSLRPIELGRRLIRDIDDHRTIDVKGRVIAPNVFDFQVSPGDHAQFADIHEALVRELSDAAREYARDEGYNFVGPVQVAVRPDPGLKTGRFTLTSRLQEARGGRGAGSVVHPSGERTPLGEGIVTIGRLPECTITVADPNVSRRHSEIRPAGTGFVIVDLNSTNGTKVNGQQITEHRLADGDEITVGSIRLRFEAS